MVTGNKFFKDLKTDLMAVLKKILLFDVNVTVITLPLPFFGGVQKLGVHNIAVVVVVVAAVVLIVAVVVFGSSIGNSITSIYKYLIFT